MIYTAEISGLGLVIALIWYLASTFLNDTKKSKKKIDASHKAESIFDINKIRLDELNEGFDRTKEITSKELKEVKSIYLTDKFEQITNVDVFIITVGLSEVWFNKANNQVFWKAIPADKFDEKKHGYRLSTVQENTENLF